MNNTWSKQTQNVKEGYLLSSRELALIERGYDQKFIEKVNAIHDDTLHKIADQIFLYITKDCMQTDAPQALFLGGQPGSGKSTLSRRFRKQADYENFVDICLDNYRTWHPHYGEIEQLILAHWMERVPTQNDTPGNDIADFTHHFSSDITDILINKLITPQNGKYFSICFEWGMRTSAEPLKCMKLLKDKGYYNEVIFLCVSKDVSLESCNVRADIMNSGEHIYRRIPGYFHELCVQTIPDSCYEIYEQGYLSQNIIDAFSLRSRDNAVLFEGDEAKNSAADYSTKSCSEYSDDSCDDYSAESCGEYSDNYSSKICDDSTEIKIREIFASTLLSGCDMLPDNDLEEAKISYYTESVGILKNEKWFAYLLNTHQQNYNVERVRIVERSHKNFTLNYVENTLRFAQDDATGLPADYSTALIRSLQWAEVAKAGDAQSREKWMLEGFELSIHNEASAQIYMQETDDPQWIRQVTEALIRTHGMLGQMLRGETDSDVLQPLIALLNSGLVQPNLFEKMLYAQNRAVIKAASNQIWQNVKQKISGIIHTICMEKELPKPAMPLDRLHLLFPHAYGSVDALEEAEIDIYQNLLPGKALWYPQAALDTFSREEITTIFQMIREHQPEKTRNISFERLMKTLYYDYEGKRRINVYKKRIMEYFLKELLLSDENSHMKPCFEVSGSTIYFDVKFTSVCERLIDFCVEAERSGFMEYQKNIIAIFDLFGFRRDIFDRLNNEDKYLDTMNDTAESRKNEIIDYVTGHSVVDVGSGGGVLLDILENTYPEHEIIGTDISTNVIETLQNKIQKEGHHYRVLRHNFVEHPLAQKTDSILFSSILHEVYSYTEYEDKHFMIESVKSALENAIQSLNPNGRIIIRDGIMSDEKRNGANDKDIVEIRLRTPEGITFAQNYLHDFNGLSHLRDSNGDWLPGMAELSKDGTLRGNINLIREFLYTYTWGIESYSCEVNEQFGYFYLNDFTAFLESCGMRILRAESYLEIGYPEHLEPLVELKGDLKWEDMPSSCIIVAEK